MVMRKFRPTAVVTTSQQATDLARKLETCRYTIREHYPNGKGSVFILDEWYDGPDPTNAPDNRDREDNATIKTDADEVSGSSDCSPIMD